MAQKEKAQPKRPRGRPATKTRRLTDQLRGMLPDYPVGSFFLSDREICRRFKVSPPVARSAMSHLVECGLVRRVTGKGTFVQSHTAIQHTDQALKIVVFSCIGSQYPHNDAVHAIEEVLRQHGHTLVIRNNEKLAAGEIERIALLIDEALQEADGVIWISGGSDEHPQLPDMLRHKVKQTVFVNLRFDDHAATCVVRDDRAGLATLTNHVIRQGHERIAYLGGSENRLPFRLRYQGFCDAMRRAGLPFEQRWQRPYQKGESYQLGYDAADALVKLKDRPTACICFVDPMAYGVLTRLTELGLSVPGDMALAGFDNLHNPAIPTLLTSMDLAFGDIGRQAAIQLVSQLDGTARPGTILYVPCPLVVRASTDPSLKPEQHPEPAKV